MQEHRGKPPSVRSCTTDDCIAYPNICLLPWRQDSVWSSLPSRRQRLWEWTGVGGWGGWADVYLPYPTLYPNTPDQVALEIWRWIHECLLSNVKRMCTTLNGLWFWEFSKRSQVQENIGWLVFLSGSGRRLRTEGQDSLFSLWPNM